MLFDVFSEQFPRWFQDHVSRLKADPQFRSDFQTSVKDIPLIVWETSPKWKLTAKFCKLIHPCCQACGSIQNLQAHHKNYKHLGVEILFPDDLQTLCPMCHEAVHQMTVWPAVRCQPVQSGFHFPMR